MKKYLKKMVAIPLCAFLIAALLPLVSSGYVKAEDLTTADNVQDSPEISDDSSGLPMEEHVIPLSGTIPKGVTIGGVDVSGMNAAQAEEKLNDMLRVYDGTRFTLTAGDASLEATGADVRIRPMNTEIIGAAINYGKIGNIIERYVANSDINSGKGKSFDLTLTCDWESVKNFMDANGDTLNRAPVNHGLVREGGHFNLIEGHSGISVDTSEAATVVTDYITTQWDRQDATIPLPAQVQEPKGSKEDLLSVKDLLGSFNTDFSSSSNARAANVRNGASKLDKSVLYPGESFSVSTNLGKRNAENGYHLAASYENGTTVDTYGGGICQISTTLYNAVIRSELEIVERSPHSMVVSYVKPSMDAAISEGSKDFIFRNNLNYPIYIEGYTSGMTLYFNIFGKEERPAGRKISFESEVLSTVDPPDKFVADPNLPVGRVQRTQSAHTGYTARLWKTVTVDGVQQSRNVFNNSSYRASSAIYAVGTASDSADAKNAINNALASQNKDTINAAASAWSAEGIASGANLEASGESTGEESQATTTTESGNSSSSSSQSTDTTETATTAPAQPTPDPAPAPTPAPEPDPATNQTETIVPAQTTDIYSSEDGE